MEFPISRWSVKTHTVIATWGEFGPTREDIVALTCLPIFGEANTIKVVLDETEYKKLEAMKNALCEPKKSKKSTSASW